MEKMILWAIVSVNVTGIVAAIVYPKFRRWFVRFCEANFNR